MTRYRLPMALGGLQYEAVAETYGDTGSSGEVAFDLPGVSRRLWVSRNDLVRIDPPTPPVWSIASVETAVESDAEPLGLVFHHRPFRAASAWFRAGSTRAHSWPEVCSLGTVTVVTAVPRSVLRYAVEALAASSDNGDQYCASQIAEALGTWDQGGNE